MKKKKKKIKIIIISMLLIVLLVLLIMFLYSKRLVFDYDKTILLKLNQEAYNIDNINKIKNGKVITDKILIDTSKVGEEKITLEIENYFKKVVSFSYMVNVIDDLAPVITFKREIDSYCGMDVDLLKDVSALDNSNEDIDINVEGEYDINKVGDYKLYYTAKDSSGNTSREEFILHVKEKPVTTAYTSNINVPDRTFTTSKGFSGVTKNGVTYIDGYLIANKTYSLPSTYGSGLTSEVMSAFYKMQAGALVEGLNIYISSGFRSYNDQYIIYNNYVKRDGVVGADTYSARAGHSEHQTGLAFDVNIINDSFANTKEAIWLNDNCYKYGFILRYPKGKSDETGYKYESWHFRYVGVELATILYNNGDWITMENYFGITSQY